MQSVQEELLVGKRAVHNLDVLPGSAKLGPIHTWMPLRSALHSGMDPLVAKT